MTYNELIDTIENKRRLGRESGADVCARLLKEAGIEEEPAPFIHVAGTNGKGSCIAMIDSILREAGFKVGRFTSPHLEDFRERIVVNGEMISKDDTVRLGNKVMALPSVEAAAMFDLAFMLAVLYFAEQECDFWLVETGLGGLKDATNALGTPLISVITSIGLDHEAQLGHTVAQIAGEKAGIIKPDSVCVTGPQSPEALEVIENACDKNDIFLIEMEPIDDDELELSLAGDFQRENAGIAMGVINILCDLGVKILPSDIDSGFKKALWPGRMESFGRYIIDGAHNSPGMKALVTALEKDYPGETFHVCFGCASDKNSEELIELLKPVTKDIVFTASNSDRAKDPEELKALGEAAGMICETAGSCEEAIKALSNKRDNEKCLICGSLYLIGEMRKLMQA